jgi:AcrR family transcriptional regulator
MTNPGHPAPTLRERHKAQTRNLILDAMVAAFAAGEVDETSHEALARRAGVARQTVYRHFPDREALLSAVWDRINAMVAAHGLPQTEADLVDRLAPLYARFDEEADLITVAQGTPQGRAMRMAVRERRAAAFRQAAASATAELSPEDATQAVAVLQLLLGGQAWIEMRQQWGLSGAQAARACGWAIQTLLADLHARGGRSLDEPS